MNNKEVEDFKEAAIKVEDFKEAAIKWAEKHCHSKQKAIECLIELGLINSDGSKSKNYYEDGK